MKSRLKYIGLIFFSLIIMLININVVNADTTSTSCKYISRDCEKNGDCIKMCEYRTIWTPDVGIVSSMTCPGNESARCGTVSLFLNKDGAISAEWNTFTYGTGNAKSDNLNFKNEISSTYFISESAQKKLKSYQCPKFARISTDTPIVCIAENQDECKNLTYIQQSANFEGSWCYKRSKENNDQLHYDYEDDVADNIKEFFNNFIEKNLSSVLEKGASVFCKSFNNLMQEVSNTDKLLSSFTNSYNINNTLFQTILSKNKKISTTFLNEIESLQQDVEKNKDLCDKKIDTSNNMTKNEKENLKDTLAESKKEVNNNLESLAEKFTIKSNHKAGNADFAYDESCEGLFGDVNKSVNSDGSRSVAYILNKIFDIFKIAAPILVIVLSAVGFLMALLSQDNDALKKESKNFMIRLILAISLFLLPMVLQFLLNIIGQTSPFCGVF